MTNKLLTLDEAAARLRVHVATLRRYINEGKIECVKIVGKKYVLESVVDKIVSEGLGDA